MMTHGETLVSKVLVLNFIEGSNYTHNDPASNKERIYLCIKLACSMHELIQHNFIMTIIDCFQL